ncbi:hypothetical protein BDV12DRAFT_196239 [Aspergillus spectabilis]
MASKSRDDFSIAIICALAHEATAVRRTFDEKYASFTDKQKGDLNVYHTGKIGNHNVVLCPLQGMGKGMAAAAVSSLKTSFTKITLVLLVGICGGYPSLENDRQVYLGDVLVGKSLIEYDHGHKYPDVFEVKKTPLQLNREAGTILASFEMEDILEELENQLSQHLKESQRSGNSPMPPINCPDVVYRSDYQHKHNDKMTTRQCSCSKGGRPCQEAMKASCVQLGCDEEQVVRKRAKTEGPRIHIGPIASGDLVMKSGVDRDNEFRKHEAIGFEMEGAGVWDGMATCLIVKGVCDYADSHKNKSWQPYAAATGAAAAKTIISYWKPPTKKQSKSLSNIPFPRNLQFTGRNREIERLERAMAVPNGPKKKAIVGLGGIGKTQIALELAFRAMERDPDHTIFWIPCTSIENIDKSYVDIARELGEEDVNPVNARELVHTHISGRATKWLLVLDNLDDWDIWEAIKDGLPESSHGYVLATTRSNIVAYQVAYYDLMPIRKPEKEDAIDMLRRKLTNADLLKDERTTIALLEQLAYLPLAISQAAAYLDQRPGLTLSDYLDLLAQHEGEIVKLLSRDFTENGRYEDAHNPIITTWLISFEQILKVNPAAADYLRLMACVSRDNIPPDFLPPLASKMESLEALGLLSAFSFITTHSETRSLSMHRLVHLATRNWMRENEQFDEYLHKAAGRLEEIFPDSTDVRNRQLWRKYLPHVISLVNEEEFSDKPEYLGLSWNAAQCLSTDGRYDEAQELFTGILKIQRQENGDLDPSTIHTMAYVASTYNNQGQLEKAAEVGTQALAASQRALPADDGDTLLITAILSAIYKAQGRWTEAEPLDISVVEGHKRSFGPKHLDTLTCMGILGVTYRMLGKEKEEEYIGLYILKTCQEEFGPSSSEALGRKKSLASIYKRQSRLTEAKELLSQVMEVGKQHLGSGHPLVLSATLELAQLHMGLKDFEQAEELATRVVDQSTEVLGPRHPDTLSAMSTLAALHALKGRLQEAEETELKVLEIRKQVDRSHPSIAESLQHLAQIYESQGRKEKAKMTKDEAFKVATREDLLGPSHPQVLENKFELVTRASGGGEYARSLMAQIVEGAKQGMGPNHPRTVYFVSYLAEMEGKAARIAMATGAVQSGPEPPAAQRTRRRDKLAPKALFDRAWKVVQGSD